jgi:hypothetical protein
MILDSEVQKTIILKMIEQSSITGEILDVMYELKQAVKAAEIFNKQETEQNNSSF